MAQPRTGDLGDEDVARRDAAQLAFAADDARAPGGAADAGGLASQYAIRGTRLGEEGCGLDPQRAGLDELEPARAEDPFDLDGMAEEGLGTEEQGPELGGLRTIETRVAGSRDGPLVRAPSGRVRLPRLNDHRP